MDTPPPIHNVSPLQDRSSSDSSDCSSDLSGMAAEAGVTSEPGGGGGGGGGGDHDDDDDSRLRSASYEGDVQLATQLLRRGASVDTRRARNGATALCIAAGAGHAAVVRLLCAAGAALAATNANGAAPVFLVRSRASTP